MALTNVNFGDNMAIALDKVNKNFQFVGSLSLGQPTDVWANLSWGLSPGQLVDNGGVGASSYSRADSALAFDRTGYVTQFGSGTLRLVPGKFGGKAAMKTEGISTNLFTQSTIKDLDSNGIADGWTFIGNINDALATVEGADIGFGSEQVILTQDSLQVTGVEHTTTASVNHLGKSYIASAILKLTNGTPTNFEVVVQGYNNASTLIFEEAFPLTKWTDVGTNSNYEIHTAKVSTPTVLDFGNLTGFEGDTISTVAVVIRFASTTEFTSHIWYVALQEGPVTTPIFTDGTEVTTVPDLLTWTWPTDVKQSGGVSFWMRAPIHSDGSSFLLFGSAAGLRIEAVDRDVHFKIPYNSGTVTVVSKNSVNVFDGELHHVNIGWDNYQAGGLLHMPAFLAIDGVDQPTNGDAGVSIDLKTQRPCVDASSDVAAASWQLPVSTYFGTNTTFVNIENPFISNQPTLSPTLAENMFSVGGPLLCSGTMTSLSPTATATNRRVGAFALSGQTLVSLEPNVIPESELVVMDGVSQDKTAGDYTVDYGAGEVTLSTPMTVGIKYFVMYQIAV